ncbi:hypothetical protein EPR50_G00142120 [Perca flavescens]|uniref:Uncharacterized protein n=1 Tax=Perca flavescens TaxID=8167 RepID=A0A484CTA0_PERFV|nr:hypothetical protein EPR50_G00142120 [Perca flavescens]
MYARAVWVEHGKEVEGTAPDNWIDVDNKTIRWPKKGEKSAFLNKHPPQHDWMTFTLVKRKMTSVNICECDDYDMTSYVEEEEQENEEVRGRRKKTQRKFEDYVLESDELEAEENVTGAIIKAPSFPIPPTKTLDVQIQPGLTKCRVLGPGTGPQATLDIQM